MQPHMFQRRNLYSIVTVEEEPFVYIEEPLSDGEATYCRAMSLPCLSVEAVLQSNLTNDILNKIIIGMYIMSVVSTYHQRGQLRDCTHTISW